MSWKNGDPSQILYATQQPKKNPLATCSTFGHIIKDFAMQNHRRANLQE